LSDQPETARAPEAQRPASSFRLNLEQQRNRAKELLQGLRASEADALDRFRRHHPRLANASDPALPDGIARLSEAQLVIARELGLPSWPRLKAHVEAMDRSWARIRCGEVAPDRGMATLHVRCGSDIGPGLKQAGFVGDFLEYSDPFCQGPVPAGSGWLDQRADFLAQAYGPGSGMSRDGIEAKLRQAEEELRSAPLRYERVVLWFEHDSYDQLILARCLAQFAERAPSRLELISPGHYPGGMRFIGLGQLPPEALRLLWEERAPVPAAALRVGQKVWDALRSPDPRGLAALAAEGTAGVPQLGRALRRHCQELPWTGDGLSLTERLILQLLAEEPRTAQQVFSRLMVEREPLPWMSDLIFRDILEGMRRVEQPVLIGAFEGEDHRWPSERLTITELGRAVLAGEVDWLSLRPPARWLGGVLIPGPAPCWRWDDRTASAVNC
jgi:Domain of unknown function (DUF1835)